MDLIIDGLKRGVKPETFAAAFKKDLGLSGADNDPVGKQQQPSLKDILFEDPTDGAAWEASFVSKAEKAFSDLAGKYPEFGSVMDHVSETNTCRVTAARVDQIFENLQSAGILAEEEEEEEDEWTIWDYVFPDCGNWWKKTKFTACLTVCSLAGGVTPPAVIACGWACWCMLCDAEENPYNDLMC